MVNVEKFEEFSTCIYRFKHKFENTDRKNMLDFILLESMKQEGNEKFQRLGSQLNDRLHDNDIFKPLVDSILESSHDVMEDLDYEYDSLEITNMWANILKPKSSAKFIIACISFGKQLPPKPNLPSGPGTAQCDLPNLSS